MQATAARPEGANWLTPYITVSNPDMSLVFYEKAFGFKPGNTMPAPDGKIGHAEMHYQGTLIIMFAPEGAWGSTCKTPAHTNVEPSIGLYVYCENVDDLVKQAKKAGAKVIQEPETMFWGDRTARFRDLDGYAWTFATKVGEFDPSKMPK